MMVRPYVVFGILLTQYLLANVIWAGSLGARDARSVISPRIAIVIDDLGYRYEPGELLATLPYPITMAVLPNAPYAFEIAELATDEGQELILHVPMETVHEGEWEEGLTTAMNATAFTNTINAMLDDFPHVVGINNHGGSMLTADRGRMYWVMKELAQRELYFLDSRTTSASTAIAAAQAFGVDHASRDVFLDHVQSDENIAAEFDRLRQIAREFGQAIGIGHPHPETIAQLRHQLPALIAEGFELTYCSKLLTRAPNKPTDYSRHHVQPIR